MSFTEGAEQGHIQNIAAAATLMARTTCNRDLYILMEAPSYGYDTSTAARLANEAGGFLTCADDTDVTLSVVGWVPGTTLPTAVGADGNTYSADSTSVNSPWLESMVFPENPSGVIKTPQLPANRRVCDACYIYPMFFGMNDFTVPTPPECMAWAGSVTKLYSASVRAGYIIYKNDDAEQPYKMTFHNVMTLSLIHI